MLEGPKPEPAPAPEPEPEFKPLSFVKGAAVQQPDFSEAPVVVGARQGDEAGPASAPAEEPKPSVAPMPMPPPPPPAAEGDAGASVLDIPPPPPIPGPPPSGPHGGEPEEPEEEEIIVPGEVVGLGKVFVEFTRPEVASEAAYHFWGREFDGRPLTVRYYPLKWYQKNFRKGLVPVRTESLDRRGVLPCSDPRLPRLFRAIRRRPGRRRCSWLSMSRSGCSAPPSFTTWSSSRDP